MHTLHMRNKCNFAPKPVNSSNMCFSVPLVHVDGCESEDEELVTVVEKEKVDVDKKIIIVSDKYRTVEKMLMPDNLEDFLNQGIIGG